MADRDTTSTPYKLSFDGKCYFSHPNGDKFDDELKIAREIRYEATLPNYGVAPNVPGQDDVGHPLPLQSSWWTGGGPPGVTLQAQLDRIFVEGKYVLLPIFLSPPTHPDHRYYWGDVLDTIRIFDLPVSLIIPNQMGILFNEPYFSLPPETNACIRYAGPTDDPDTFLKTLDPLAPSMEIVAQGGAECVTRDFDDTGYPSAYIGLQQKLPNQTRMFVRWNNEDSKAKSNDVWRNVRFREQHPEYGPDWDGRPSVPINVAQNVTHGPSNRNAIEFNASFRGALTAWQNATFVAYGGGSKHTYQRGWGWDENWEALTQDDPIPLENPLTWQGYSPDTLYMNDWEGSCTDCTCWSPQLQAQNNRWIQDAVYAKQPDAWYELSVWCNWEKWAQVSHGNAAGELGLFTFDRLRAAWTFGMWIHRPRSLVTFVGWASKQSEADASNDLAASICDTIHKNPTLKRFWRKGTLVENHDRDHPWDFPPASTYNWTAGHRWFQLTTSVDNPDLTVGRGVTWSSVIPVFAVAHVLGDAPNREWLIFVSCPQDDYATCDITIPGYKAVSVGLDSIGKYYLVDEDADSVEEVVVWEPWKWIGVMNLNHNVIPRISHSLSEVTP